MDRREAATVQHTGVRTLLALVLAAATSIVAAQSPKGDADPALLADLLRWASRLSGLPAAPDLPPLRALPAAELARQVCPQRPSDCRTLIAIYNTERREVLYRDTLDLRDETDQSFIVHELVHYLQHRVEGDQLFATCERVMTAETGAYAAQNRYLAHFKQWRRVGEMLHFAHCDAATAEPVYRPDQPSTLTSRSPQQR